MSNSEQHYQQYSEQNYPQYSEQNYPQYNRTVETGTSVTTIMIFIVVIIVLFALIYFGYVFMNERSLKLEQQRKAQQAILDEEELAGFVRTAQQAGVFKPE